MSRDVPRPFQGRFVVRWLRLATINLYTKYEVSTFTHYEDMKGDEKMQTFRWFGDLGIIQGHRKHRHLIERI